MRESSKDFFAKTKLAEFDLTENNDSTACATASNPDEFFIFLLFFNIKEGKRKKLSGLILGLQQNIFDYLYKSRC